MYNFVIFFLFMINISSFSDSYFWENLEFVLQYVNVLSKDKIAEILAGEKIGINSQNAKMCESKLIFALVWIICHNNHDFLYSTAVKKAVLLHNFDVHRGVFIKAHMPAKFEKITLMYETPVDYFLRVCVLKEAYPNELLEAKYMQFLPNIISNFSKSQLFHLFGISWLKIGILCKYAFDKELPAFKNQLNAYEFMRYDKLDKHWNKIRANMINKSKNTKAGKPGFEPGLHDPES